MDPPKKSWDQVKAVASTCASLIGRAFRLFWVYFYSEMLQRNTIEPLQIIGESDDDKVVRLLSRWTRLKTEESKYIQLAGGFLFTTVASCLQWPSIDRSHWSGAALFYSSLLFALVSIVCGSQQLLVLRNIDDHSASNMDSPSGDAQKQKNDAIKVRNRLTKYAGDGHSIKLKTRFIFMLQAPIMLLTFSVMTFLAGLCSVVFSPLGQDPGWNSNAKIAIVFGLAGLLTIAVFVSTSKLIYALFESAYTVF